MYDLCTHADLMDSVLQQPGDSVAVIDCNYLRMAPSEKV